MYTQQSTETPRLQVAKGWESAELAGRILLAAIFLASGLSKIGAYAGTAAYMASAGVPGSLLPLVIITEVLGSIAIILGYQTRTAAFLLAGFTMLAGLIFHHNFADQNQAIHFLKNVSMVGGLLVLTVNGAGAFSLDQRLKRKVQVDRET